MVCTFLGSVVKPGIQRERRALVGNSSQALSAGPGRTHGQSFLQGYWCGIFTVSLGCVRFGENQL